MARSTGAVVFLKGLSTVLQNTLYNFLKEQAMLGSTLITDSDVREKINLTHVNNLDEYNKVFINLAARVE